MINSANSKLNWFVRFLAIGGLLSSISTVSAQDEFESLFNGKDLSGWEGDTNVWSVEDGAIVGQTTSEEPLQSNTFLIWKGGQVDDFELRLQYRMKTGNSGIQYRSKIEDPNKWIMSGYQADFESGKNYTGILYEERGRGILAQRGQHVEIASDGTRETEQFADAAELQEHIHGDDWNDYLIEARGNLLRHTINGHLMSETIDKETDKRASRGHLGFQVHTGPPMKVEFRDIRLTRIEE